MAWKTNIDEGHEARKAKFVGESLAADLVGVQSEAATWNPSSPYLISRKEEMKISGGLGG